MIDICKTHKKGKITDHDILFNKYTTMCEKNNNRSIHSHNDFPGSSFLSYISYRNVQQFARNI